MAVIIGRDRTKPMSQGLKTMATHVQIFDHGARLGVLFTWPDGTQKGVTYTADELLAAAGLSA